MALTRLVPGNQLRTLPGGTWNQFCDATDFVEQMRRQGPGIPAGVQVTPQWRQAVDIVPAGDYKIGDVVVLEIDADRLPADDAMGPAAQPPVFTATLYTAETHAEDFLDSKLWGVINRPVTSGKQAANAATVRGLAYARVLLIGDDSRYCGPAPLRYDAASTVPQLTNQRGSYGAKIIEVVEDPLEDAAEASWALIDVGSGPAWNPAAAVLTSDLLPNTYDTAALSGTGVPTSTQVRLIPAAAATGVKPLFPLIDDWGVGSWNDAGTPAVRTIDAYNATGSRIEASSSRPRLVFGFVGDDVLWVTGVQQGAVVHGLAQAAVTSGDITLTTVETQIGLDPWWHRLQEVGFNRAAQTLVVTNPFGFAVAQGGLVRAEENDYGVWQAVQAECP